MYLRSFLLTDRVSSCFITNCSRVIRNAWHFYYALRLV
ncbi:DUF3265 domain-containing protein, partial [Vibrio anguillarum]|nr:DUF3265 domain-containing protein [Vibrio anguillarum]